MRDQSVRAAQLAADSSESIAARTAAVIPCRALGKWLLSTLSGHRSNQIVDPLRAAV